MFSEAKETVFIGDIHGHAPTLLALLEQLGWRQRDGRLAGPGGQALVFVGDLIDRGPQNLGTVEIVRELVERGDALCLMGNHEFNAVQFHTPDPKEPGEHLRRQSEKNRKQHRAVLDEIERRPGDWSDMLAWFRTLPLAAEGEGWRCVHACWHPPSLDVFQHRQGQWFLPESAWEPSARRGTPEHLAVEILLKGPEARLPDGATFLDKDGIVRDRGRIRWWEPAPKTLAEAMLFQTRPEGLDLHARYESADHPGYPEDAPPVLFGHYWRSGEIRAERPNAACLDYSVAKATGRLVAYRWRGESRIERGRFVSQGVVEHGRLKC